VFSDPRHASEAAGLASVAFLALLMADLLDVPDEGNLIGGVIFWVWLLSLTSAAATAAIGATLGVMQFLVRHRTRPA
jgi:hypothetical protein